MHLTKDELIKLKDKHEEIIKNRQKSNKKLLTILKEYITKYSNFRFIQLLWLLGIVNNKDRFYEESAQTLEIVLKKLNNSSK